MGKRRQRAVWVPCLLIPDLPCDPFFSRHFWARQVLLPGRPELGRLGAGGRSARLGPSTCLETASTRRGGRGWQLKGVLQPSEMRPCSLGARAGLSNPQLA